ncbi:hypothetical protein HWN74_26770, partial [Escherichia coli]|nr:hypothetical protein [Escherichia coli]
MLPASAVPVIVSVAWLENPLSITGEDTSFVTVPMTGAVGPGVLAKVTTNGVVVIAGGALAGALAPLLPVVCEATVTVTTASLSTFATVVLVSVLISVPGGLAGVLLVAVAVRGVALLSP